ncbi:hypothetical protein OPV22_012607 [Ensete ventricosum]|uniref:Actin-related protein 4 n=2 Tax=Magnoliopsida TaxID=3398 RepID=A0AAV8R302_ENSVE|nr:hypothetical protein OPV22_012607 [Ensete ventricosum]
MYGGDEVSAIVLDLGSYTCKAGYAGEDAPKAVFPSVVGSIYQAGATDEVKHEKDSDSMYDSENADKTKTRKLYVGTQALGYRRGHMEVISPIKDGVVVDWDIVDNIWNHAFRERLLIDPKEHPMLLAEPSSNTPQQREKAAELMFESYKVPALFLAKNAVLTSFASGRATSLVVDSGGGSTTVAAVHDGYVLQKLLCFEFIVLTLQFCHDHADACLSILILHDVHTRESTFRLYLGRSSRQAPPTQGNVNMLRTTTTCLQAVSTSPIGGEFLTDCMMKSLESKGVMIKPRYSFKRKEIRPGEFQTVDLDIPNTTESYKLYSQRAIASDIKESVCRVPDTAFEESAYANVPMTPYELPDGQTIEIGADRFKIPDVLFNPSLVQTIPGMESFAGSTSVNGLPQMVIESINRCDADIKRELFSSILLAGGTASMLQLKERLEKELMEEAPQAARVKVLASGNSIERRFSVWIGGSILASLGSFQQLWFSKAEYEEHGVSNIQRKQILPNLAILLPVLMPLARMYCYSVIPTSEGTAGGVGRRQRGEAIGIADSWGLRARAPQVWNLVTVACG